MSGLLLKLSWLICWLRSFQGSLNLPKFIRAFLFIAPNKSNNPLGLVRFPNTIADLSLVSKTTFYESENNTH